MTVQLQARSNDVAVNIKFDDRSWDFMTAVEKFMEEAAGLKVSHSVTVRRMCWLYYAWLSLALTKAKTDEDPRDALKTLLHRERELFKVAAQRPDFKIDRMTDKDVEAVLRKEGLLP
jgi:hypothetical protein